MHRTPPRPQDPTLFDPVTPDVLSVRDVVGGLKDVVEARFADVWVEGELSNFKQYGSGHCYFTLKDSDAQIRCVMWRHFTRYLFFRPQDGMLIRVHGKASVYEPRGELQLVVQSMRPAGEGALQQAFEALKRKLEAEGLFDADRKRPLPAFPEAIGLVTSGDGAALHDILSILGRRFPHVRVLVCPVRVQGLGAAEMIADAVDAFNALPEGDPLRPDVLIVGRGGGSIEDLWAFNEEVVARAVYRSTIPVISAVGHETDYSITDYVADVRAATPSMAAELAVPDRREVEALLRGLHGMLQERMHRRIDASRQHIRMLTGSYRFNLPRERLRQERRQLESLLHRLHRSGRHAVEAQRGRLETACLRLHLLDPMRPLHRGYAWVEQDGTPVRRADALAPGDRLRLRFADGVRTARVESDGGERPERAGRPEDVPGAAESRPGAA